MFGIVVCARRGPTNQASGWYGFGGAVGGGGGGGGFGFRRGAGGARLWVPWGGVGVFLVFASGGFRFRGRGGGFGPVFSGRGGGFSGGGWGVGVLGAGGAGGRWAGGGLGGDVSPRDAAGDDELDVSAWSAGVPLLPHVFVRNPLRRFYGGRVVRRGGRCPLLVIPSPFCATRQYMTLAIRTPPLFPDRTMDCVRSLFLSRFSQGVLEFTRATRDRAVRCWAWVVLRVQGSMAKAGAGEKKLPRWGCSGTLSRY